MDGARMIHVSDDNIRIENSYTARSRKEIREVLGYIKYYYPGHLTFKNNSDRVLVAEWCVHNLLYNLNVLRSRTKDVDLNSNKTKLEKIAYLIASLFYWK